MKKICVVFFIFQFICSSDLKSISREFCVASFLFVNFKSSFVAVLNDFILKIIWISLLTLTSRGMMLAISLKIRMKIVGDKKIHLCSLKKHLWIINIIWLRGGLHLRRCLATSFFTIIKGARKLKKIFKNFFLVYFQLKSNFFSE